MAIRTISAAASIGSVRQATPAQLKCQVVKRPFFGAPRLVNRAGRVGGLSATLQQVLELAQEIDAKTSTEGGYPMLDIVKSIYQMILPTKTSVNGRSRRMYHFEYQGSIQLSEVPKRLSAATLDMP
jgi:hypothetical protein